MKPIEILALEPYHGGSHRAFIEGWMNRSRHKWSLFKLPPRKWKWRSRHASVTLAREVAGFGTHTPWNLIFCSEMLNLAEFRGLSNEAVRSLPGIVYFHENQITYPVQEVVEQDHHFSFSNMITALAAHRVWFNSAYHRDSFLEGLESLLRRMPDYRPLKVVAELRDRSRIRPPGIEPFPARRARPAGPLHILWAARWEYDKNPEDFFRAMDLLEASGVDFRLSVIGGGNETSVLPVFEAARKRHATRILHWGYQENREDYKRVLTEADVIVSTARHEFFGIGLVEAVAAGAFPLVPRRLAYPEVLSGAGAEGERLFFYKESPRDLARRLEELAQRLSRDDLWNGNPDLGVQCVAGFHWEKLVPAWDDEVEELAARLSHA